MKFKAYKNNNNEWSVDVPNEIILWAYKADNFNEFEIRIQIIADAIKNAIEEAQMKEMMYKEFKRKLNSIYGIHCYTRGDGKTLTYNEYLKDVLKKKGL